MNIRILYGTESGNAEMIADDLAEALAEAGDVTVADLQDTDPTTLSSGDVHLVICSTYGEGDLPASAQPFYEQLIDTRPDLSGMRYAMFGLGDSGYADTYSKGSERLVAAFDELGATRIGEYGRHDAASFDDASELAIDWAMATIDLLVTA